MVPEVTRAGSDQDYNPGCGRCPSSRADLLSVWSANNLSNTLLQRLRRVLAFGELADLNSQSFMFKQIGVTSRAFSKVHTNIPWQIRLVLRENASLSKFVTIHDCFSPAAHMSRGTSEVPVALARVVRRPFRWATPESARFRGVGILPRPTAKPLRATL